jgi:biotin carboxyl carrier protein
MRPRFAVVLWLVWWRVCHTNAGQQVQNNELLSVLDAMKMEIKITAQSAGTIKSIVVAQESETSAAATQA